MHDVNKPERLLILLKGHPCTGKSTIAKELSELLSCPLIDKDDVKNPLWSELSSTLEPTRLNSLAYSILSTLVRAQLQLGLHCIVDCPLARKNFFDELQSIARETKSGVVLIECVISDETVWKQRLELRNDQLRGTPEAHKVFTWDELQDHIEKYEECWKWSEKDSELDLVHHTVINSTQNENVALELKNLKQKLLSTKSKDQ